MEILMNLMQLSNILSSVMQIIGASHKIVELLDYQPKINTAGGEMPPDENETEA